MKNYLVKYRSKYWLFVEKTLAIKLADKMVDIIIQDGDFQKYFKLSEERKNIQYKRCAC